MSLRQAQNHPSENSCVTPVQNWSRFDHSGFFRRNGINVFSFTEGQIILFPGAFLLFWLLKETIIRTVLYKSLCLSFLFVYLSIFKPFSDSLALKITIGFAWHLQGDSSWPSVFYASIYVYNVVFKYRNNAILYWRRLHPPNICLGEIGG